MVVVFVPALLETAKAADCYFLHAVEARFVLLADDGAIIALVKNSALSQHLGALRLFKLAGACRQVYAHVKEGVPLAVDVTFCIV